MSPTPKNNYYVLPVGQIGEKRPKESIRVQCFSSWLQFAWDMIVMNTEKFRISIIQCEKGKKNAIQFPGSIFVLVFDPICVNSVKIFFFFLPAWTYWLLHCSLQYLIIWGLKTKQVDISILTLYLFVNLLFFNCICNLKQEEVAKIWREKQTLIRVVNQNKTKNIWIRTWCKTRIKWSFSHQPRKKQMST